MGLLKTVVKRVRYRGASRYCCVCDSHASEFLPYGVNPRQDAACPYCNALERHRLVMTFFRNKTNLFDGRAKQVLHVAPERAIKKHIARAAGRGYLSADLMAKDVMEKMDITDIRHDDAHFDAIYCSHVLEHVPDDRLAMREFFRVLKQDGWAVLNVPVTVDVTVEDPSVTDPDERLRLFGQKDHVRCYGPDYRDRLEEEGFRVEVYSAADFLSPEEIEKQGLMNGHTGDIYFCTKP